jgi:hypothetical protein
MDASGMKMFDDSLRRLAGMQGGDPAFFVLAVHSFIEGSLRSSFSLADPDDGKFTSFLDEFKKRLVHSNQGFIKDLDVLGLIRQQHFLTNEVRHRFAPASIEEARAATQHLGRFCNLAGIPRSEGLELVLSYLKAWDDRRSFGELVKELNDLGYRYQIEKKTAKDMAVRVEALEAVRSQVESLKDQVATKDKSIAELEAARDKKDARVDELRRERAGLAAELKKAKDAASSYADAAQYLQALQRMTVLTRTRADYERTIIRLTPEQKKVLGQISLNEDFLVKGAAGTGKTLVLLKAIEDAKRGGVRDGLELQELKGSVALLTYTKTLVKYNQYLTSLLDCVGSEDRISTADAFLIDRLKELDPGLSVSFSLPEDLAKQHPAANLSVKELTAEIEGFIWGNEVGHKEYVIEGIERKGMKKPLSKEQRQAVWNAAEAMESVMMDSKILSRCLAARLLSRAVAEGAAPNLRLTDFIFIDEAQDLPAAILKAIKACARRCVILAGDADQSIYQPGFSFKRAGIDIAGRTRILKTNFRNTAQLHEVAERYRRKSAGKDEESSPEAFRDGPRPELFEAADADEMLELLIKRIALFLGPLGYTPENLCIIVPREEDLHTVQSRLQDEGLELADIRDKNFLFSAEGSVRLTTMHSAKGLDFPVVFLYIPQLHLVASTVDAGTADRMSRNLVYVAMTRAMDHLDVFLREGTANPALIDLAASFDGAAEGAAP